MSALTLFLSRFGRLALLLILGAALPLAACSEAEDTTSPAAEETAMAEDSGDAAATPDAAEEPPAEPEREQISWDLTDLYASDEEWDAAREELLAQIPVIQSYQGRLGESPEVMLEALNLQAEATQELYGFFMYAGLSRDVDQRVASAQQRFGIAQDVSSQLNQATSWVAPEILEIGAERVMEFVAADPEGFAPYLFGLQDTLRNEPHTLSLESERVLAAAGVAISQPQTTYQLLVNADIPWPTITLSDGREVRLSPVGYSQARASQNREDRIAVFDTFWSAFEDYQTTLGQILNSHVQGQVFMARSRNFESALEMNLHQDNLPTEVYDTLIEQVNGALPLFHRYLALRARILGIEDLGYHDIYPTAVEIDRTFTFEDSRELLLASVAPMGEDYVSRLEYATAQNWEHVYPSDGKRSGAYQWAAAYGLHPFILLNHQDDFDSFSTYVHEWGHGIHSMYAQENQPFTTAFYSTFIAEMAAIVNQALSEEYVIANATTDEERLFYIDRVLEQYRGTLFRQTMFAEFEAAIYNEVEQGQPLTGERLSEMYLEIARRYHGHDEGVMNVADQIGMEWAYIPHFYRNHYVFQYSTSQIQSDFYAARIMAGEEGAVESLISILQAGGSDYPYNIVLNAGLDMASAEAYQPSLSRLERMLDEYEELLDRLGY